MCSGCMCMWFAEYCLAGFAICIYMLAVVTGGWGYTGIEGVRYAVSLYKYAEPWLHACPVTYINTHTYTYTPFRQYDCHRSVCSGIEPLCVCIELQDPYNAHLLSVGISYAEYLERIFHPSVCPCGDIPVIRTISTENRFYQVIHRNFWRVVKGTKTSKYNIKKQNGLKKGLVFL